MRYKLFSFPPLFIFTLLLMGCGRARTTPVHTASPTPQANANAPPTSRPTSTEASPTDTPPLPTQTPLPPAQPSEPIPLTPEPQPAAKSEVVYNSDLGLTGYLCRPEGAGPFSAVVYNHGGLGDKIGGAPEETCDALAAAGMVGFAPIRRQTIPLDGHMDDVMAAVNYVKGLEYVAPDRLGIMGFSRGGLLAFMAAGQRPDFQAVIILASALPKEGTFSDYAQNLDAPILLMVAGNDFPAELNKGENLTEGMQEMEEALRAAGKEVQLITYPPFEPHGHLMFFEVGDYWEDVISFFRGHL